MEYHIFVEEFKRNPGTTWIMKPVSLSVIKCILIYSFIVSVGSRDCEGLGSGVKVN